MQMIPSLPPPRAAENVDAKTIEVPLAGRGMAKGSAFLLKLPPEYRHSRSYPVLMLLHREGENARDMVQRWADVAADNGVILAAPMWSSGPFATNYGYSEREHNLVLQTLFNLRRPTTSTPIASSSSAWGREPAWPSTWACPIPTCSPASSPWRPNPEYYPTMYWRNGHYLPFCTISGSCSGECEKNIRNMMEALGDPAERLSDDVGALQGPGQGVVQRRDDEHHRLDAQNKKRALPMTYLGNPGLGLPSDGNEFCSHREGEQPLLLALGPRTDAGLRQLYRGLE